MSEFAITIQYAGLKAEFFRLHKTRSRAFPKVCLKKDIRSLQVPLPRLLYLLDWDDAKVMCYWKAIGDSGEAYDIDAIRRQVDGIRIDSTVLGVLEIHSIQEVPASPLPPTLIPGVSDSVSFSLKRHCPPTQEQPRAKKARIEAPQATSAEPMVDDLDAVTRIASGKPSGVTTGTGTRAPLASVTNARVASSVVPAASSKPPQSVKSRPGTAAQGAVKAEPQDDRALLHAISSGNALPAVKTEPGSGPQLDPVAERNALHRKIEETHDRNMQLLADNARMRVAIKHTARRLGRAEADKAVLRLRKA
ncbi:hypothetical protein EVJ58_g9125 [Rhodofomes roseus]|uniref:Uncharacterized protein n=1 Tax=Rhodofomes roseus TaxID=34475 RepID=A0A4Y9XXX8_9APHY|nr:hypothetical protein EVJ58_g9125 [Rhodofomes roseus]